MKLSKTCSLDRLERLKVEREHESTKQLSRKLVCLKVRKRATSIKEEKELKGGREERRKGRKRKEGSERREEEEWRWGWETDGMIQIEFAKRKNENEGRTERRE